MVGVDVAIEKPKGVLSKIVQYIAGTCGLVIILGLGDIMLNGITDLYHQSGTLFSAFILSSVFVLYFWYKFREKNPKH